MSDSYTAIIERINRVYRFHGRTPNVWNFIDSLRTTWKHEWPESIYINKLLLSHFYVKEYLARMDEEKIKGIIPILRPLAGYAAWRTTQGIYSFDPTIFEEIWNTPVDGNIPVEILFRLPEWCIFIPTPNKQRRGKNLLGFFAHLDMQDLTDRQSKTFEISFTSMFEDTEFHESLPLYEKMTLDEIIQSELSKPDSNQSFEAPDPNIITYIKRDDVLRYEGIEPYISLCLYVASQSDQIAHPIFSDKKPHFPKAKKVKKGLRMFSPSGPTKWEVGYRMGAALRQAQENMERCGDTNERLKSSARPHIRRAH